MRARDAPVSVTEDEFLKVTGTESVPVGRTDGGATVTDWGPALSPTLKVPWSGRLARAEESPTYAVNAPSGTT